MDLQVRHANKPPQRLAGVARPPSLDDLRQVHAFAHLTGAELIRIAELASVRRAARDEEVVTRRESGRVACFSIDAEFRLTIIAPSGRQLILRRVRPGDHFGEDCSIHGIDQSDITAVAERPGEYVELSCSHFRQLLQESHALSLATLQATAQRSAALLDRVFELSVLDLRYRLIAEILRLSHSVGVETGSVVINPAPTHEEFASMVGGTREGVTRELGALADGGLIEVRRKEIRVRDLERLRAHLRARSGVRPTHFDKHTKR